MALEIAGHGSAPETPRNVSAQWQKKDMEDHVRVVVGLDPASTLLQTLRVLEAIAATVAEAVNPETTAAKESTALFFRLQTLGGPKSNDFSKRPDMAGLLAALQHFQPMRD